MYFRHRHPEFLRRCLQMRKALPIAGYEKNLYETTPAENVSFNISREFEFASRLGKHRPFAIQSLVSN
jgi:hypothetical protein